MSYTAEVVNNSDTTLSGMASGETTKILSIVTKQGSIPRIQGLAMVKTGLNNSGVTFNGSGTNDMTLANGGFTGTETTTYTVTIDTPAVGDMVYVPTTGIVGSWNVGDSVTITGYAGAGLTVALIDGTDFYIFDPTGGLINAIAALTNNTTGGTATSGGNTFVPSIDTFTWTDGTTTVATVPITTNNQALNKGVEIVFATDTGHTVGDSWTITFTANAYNMATIATYEQP